MDEAENIQSDSTTQLTDKQELFCQEYLIDLNKTKAYMRAFGVENYNTARSDASRLTTNANVSARIKELMEARSKELQVDAYFVLENLISISQKCQQAEPVLIWNGKEMVESGEYQFDSNGANKALELLGKHMGMFKDKVEHSGAIEGVKIILGKPNAD